MQNYAFVGLGAMGLPMARNLLMKSLSEESLSSLHIYDTNSSIYSSLTSLSDRVKPSSSPADAASNADVVITMLPMGTHVREVYTGPKGVVEGLRKNALCIESSTIDVTTAKHVADKIHRAGGVMVDAPVSGGALLCFQNLYGTIFSL